MKRLIIFTALLFWLVIPVFAQPMLEVTYPDGGENWEIGSTPTVTWTHPAGFDSFYIYLSRDNGDTWETLAEGLPGFVVEWTWNSGVTGPVSCHGLIKVIGFSGGNDYLDISDGTFAIITPGERSIEVTYPNGGEVWEIGDTPAITWAYQGDFSWFFVLLSRDGGENWETLAPGLFGYETEWTWSEGVTPPASGECLIEIQGYYGFLDICDFSDEVFSITGGGGGINVTMTPFSPPIIIGPGGGAFTYNIEVANNVMTGAMADIWINIALPGGSQFTLLGPVNLTLGGGSSIERDRTVSVPGSAPPGEYFCSAYAGNYPWNIFAAEGFPFIKEGGGGGFDDSNWYCGGESFPGEIPATEGTSDKFVLSAPYPNPFNAKSAISFRLHAASQVELKVFDITGREIASLVNGHLSLGYHEVVWDAEGMSSGVYFVRLEAGGFAISKKVMLIK